MIIRNNRKGKINRLRLAIVGGLLVLVAIPTFWLYRNAGKVWRENSLVSLDMETVEDLGDRKIFKGDHADFSHGETQVKGIAHSGSHSSAININHQFGPTWESSDIFAGDIYEVTVWRKSAKQEGKLIADGNWGLYKQSEPTGLSDGDGWEQHRVRVEVPVHAKEPKLKFYVFNEGQELSYFDDMVIKRLKSGEGGGVLFHKADSVPTLNLIISDKGMERLNTVRERALRKGLLQVTEQDWVKAKLEDGKEQLSAHIRLKGDWTDHLLGEKWSFRIALDPGQAWRRMVTFSVQNPNTRDFLSEWIYHQWLHKEDILSPRYSFVELRINGKSKGLYAYEEHFEKQLPESQDRREGPIMKYDEEGLWDAQEMILRNEGLMVEDRIPTFKSSDIIPFGASRALKDTAMARQVEIAQQLIAQYKTGTKSVWETFDAKKVARYYAIVDVAKAQHGFIWHNQRWYYNPVISKMEPIGFDGFTSTGPYNWLNRPFIGYARNIRYMAAGYRELMFEHFFHDQEFLKWYIHYLFQFTDKAYLDQFYASISNQLDVYESWIQKEWPDYHYDRNAFFEQAKSIRLLLMPLSKTSLKSHFQEKVGEKYRYKVFNYHCLPVVALGVGKTANKMDAPFDEEMLLDPYYDQFPAEFIDAYAPIKGDFIYFRVPGIDSVFVSEIQPWPAPEGITPEQELFKDVEPKSNEVYTVIDSLHQVRFKTGKYKTSKDILIPRGYQVWFEKGVELDLVQGAKFISKSPVLMFGREDAPIMVTSSDKSANGFTVLQAETKSEMHYVIFDNLNTLSHNGWNLTGAVSMYESEVLITHCRFVNNHCEDALNLVRCVFDFNHSYVGYTYGDGFDADFCYGIITKGNFSHTGNDGMDFSGSHITIASAFVEHAGDKGISLGEKSTIEILDATVENSIIGLASKDLTTVTVRNITLMNNEQAFTAYQKKPEYGPAKIIVEKYRAEGNKQLYVLQKDSRLKLADELIIGKK